METPENYRAVLWVRHCFGCHNKVKWKLTDISSYTKLIPSFIKETDSHKQAYKLPSYCTEELGEIQSLIFGYRLKNILRKLNNDLSMNYKKLDLYSSVLPRAMETVKLISKETIQSGLNKSSDEIKRINFIQEKIEQTIDKVNSTTLKESDAAVDLLNTEFDTDSSYCKISKDVEGLDSIEEDTEFKTQNKEEIKKNYNEFKSKVLDKLSHQNLNLIVSHSSFLQKSLEFDKDRKMENLDAYLIIYKKNSLDEWEEIPELRRLYLFAENEIIEPNTDGVLIPPVRDKRKLALKNSKNAIEHVGLKLLDGLSKTSDKTKTNIKERGDQTLLNKKSLMGSCSNEPINKNFLQTPESSPDTVMHSIQNSQDGGYKKTKKKKKSKKKKSKKKRSKNKKSKRKNKRATKKE